MHNGDQKHEDDPLNAYFELPENLIEDETDETFYYFP